MAITMVEVKILIASSNVQMDNPHLETARIMRKAADDVAGGDHSGWSEVTDIYGKPVGEFHYSVSEE